MLLCLTDTIFLLAPVYLRAGHAVTRTHEHVNIQGFAGIQLLQFCGSIDALSDT
jgi:hypothetical protein